MQPVPVSELKGVGPKTEALLEKLNIRTAEDLIRHYPARFDHYPRITGSADTEDGCTSAVFLEISGALAVIRRGRFVMTRGMAADADGAMELTWYNMPYLKKALKEGTARVFVGRVTEKNGKKGILQPQIFSREDYLALCGRPVPVYPLTAGITPRTFRSLVAQALQKTPPRGDYLTEEERVRYGLCDEDTAIRAIHAPEDMETFRRARRRIAFDGFFSFLAGVRRLKEQMNAVASEFPMQTEEALKEAAGFLPFRLTDAQRKAAEDIARDLSSGRVMNRLIQGDVGSGKTAVAVTALYTAFRNGFQSAIMVPTEVLARQHYESMTALFENAERKPVLALLTGSLKPAEKRAVQERIAAHEADIIIGTHALIQDAVRFSRLALVVTDEQHRFGVAQRGALAEKGPAPHMLVMSATPIPRTLAVILYGDLDISTIETKPVGRIPVKNAVIRKKDRPKAFLHIKREVEAGRQAYIICPLVEASELCDEENVTDYGAKVAEIFAGTARVAVLHGRMKEAEKLKVMEDFASHRTDILVSTTVVEVGVDVPNATVMMIENAERFGLASLHQLRGRVGRGKHQSYCIFVMGKRSQHAEERLEILKNSNDGFEIAAADLKMRGPGELFGSLQSGELTFPLADIYNDYSVLQAAKEAVESRETLPEMPGTHLKEDVIL